MYKPTSLHMYLTYCRHSAVSAWLQLGPGCGIQSSLREFAYI